MRLEELAAGTRVIGIVPGGPVHVLAATPMGADAYRVVYETPGGDLGQQILMRANEAQLSLVEERATPYDADPEEFKLAAEALRIQTAAQTDPMLAVTSSDLEALPHQIEAVYGYLLDRVPLRFLLADDPGAGKTIMAGLLMKELHLRGDLDRCLVVAPGGLVEQWQDELMEKFGLKFPILSADDIAGTPPGETAFDDLPRVIARMDQLARSDSLIAQLKETTWDLVIVDEAHRMSARYAARREIKATKRYRLGQALRDTTQHLLLMTATPHAGKEEDFQLFLALLDADRYEGRYRRDVHSTGADNLMVRRIKEELLTFSGTPLFPLRAAYTVPYELSPGETELYNRVTEYVGQEFNRVDELQKSKDARGNTVGFALTVLQRRLASSPEAILRSLERRKARLEKSLEDSVANGKVKARTPAVDLRAVAEEFPAAEREEFEDEFVDAATASRTPDELRREIAMLDGLVIVARSVRAAGADRKWLELRRLLETTPEIHGPGGEPRKLIVFTEHRDTLRYLIERIRALLGRHDAVVEIHGSVSRDDRRAVQVRFMTDPTCLVLVATDAAGEGLNLHRAHLMVNYDLPWNPNRIEQRFGRIHRIGQTEMCHLWNLVAANTREGAVFKRLFDKIAEMNKALGDKVFDVLGEAFEEEPLHELLIQAVRHGEQPEVREHLTRVIDERIGDIAAKLVREKALNPNLLKMADVERIRRELEEARARRLQPHYVEGFFRDAFGHADGRLIMREKGRWEIPHVPQPVRERRRLSGPIPLRYERVCFDRSAVRIDRGVTAQLLAPGHPLLDALVDHTIDVCGDALTRGTILVDRFDPTDQPRLMVALREEIVDGMEQTVAKRFGYVEMWSDGRNRPGAAPFLDYAPLAAEERVMVENLRLEPWLAAATRTAETWATSVDLPAWYAEISARRRDFVARARELVTDRLKQEISYWEEEVARLVDSPEQGSRRGNTLRGASQEAQKLRTRLDRRLTELDAQEHTQVRPPGVVAVALVVPQGLLDARAGRPDNSVTVTLAVELRALHAVMDAERRLGREPEVMAHNNPGYDMRSVDAEGHLVHIEVKGRVAGAGEFFVTNREIRVGQNADHYRLALVEVSQDDPSHDRVRYVRDPFAELKVTALVNGVQFKWKDVWDRGHQPW